MRRSTWPNVSRDDLERRVADWAARNGVDADVVWESDETADDTIAARAGELDGPLWVVTSDRELRSRVDRYVQRLIGGGSFLRELDR